MWCLNASLVARPSNSFSLYLCCCVRLIVAYSCFLIPNPGPKSIYITDIWIVENIQGCKIMMIKMNLNTLG